MQVSHDKISVYGAGTLTEQAASPGGLTDTPVNRWVMDGGG